MKTCTKCKIEKPFEEFHKHRLRKDGLCNSCKSCCIIAAAAWRAANPEKAKLSQAAWRKANQERHRENSRSWKKANPDKKRLNNAIWQKLNPEKARASVAAWAAANPERVLANARNRRARILDAEGKHTKKDVISIFDMQRGLCAHCKVKLLKSGKSKYHVDHIMPLSKGGGNGPDNLQLLCPPCNLKKSSKDPFEWAKENGKLL